MNINNRLNKILIATGMYPPDIGGPATYSKLLFDELPKRGIEVEILSFGEVRYLPKIIRHFVYFFKIFKKAKGVDIIYAQDPVSVGLPVMLANKFLRKKFFIRIAGDYAWEQGNQRFGVNDNLDIFSAKQKGYSFFVQLFKKIQTKVAKIADQIIVPSQYFKKIISNWGIDQNKIKVIYNGIDLNSENIKKNNNLKEKIILSVGRLVPWKGFKELIEVMPDIFKKINNIKLIIIGSGPQKKELENKINKLKLKNKIILTGQISREKLLKQKQMANIFVLNSNFESFSFDIVEAMFLKLPCVATNIGSLPELIENNKQGILIKPNNKKEIENSIIKILQNDNFRQKIIQNAYQKSLQFSIKNTLNQLDDVFKKFF